MRILITGGHGFIGMELVKQLCEESTYSVEVIDKAASPSFPLASYQTSADLPLRYGFFQHDLVQKETLRSIINSSCPDWIFHLAAESHVDNSINDPYSCIQSNVVGTTNLLEVATDYYKALETSKQSQFRLLYVSTDEIYGPLTASQPPVDETPLYRCSSPYSASKAAGDLMVQAWTTTFKIPTVTTHCTNNFGPGQHTEKFIPRLLQSALDGDKLPIFGDGLQVRDWIHVSDHARALIELMKYGLPGDIYNIGASNEIQNIQLAEVICQNLDEIKPKHIGSYADQIEHVKDRAGHDSRYALNWEKVNKTIGWTPEVSFESGLKDTINWYIKNLPYLSSWAA